MRTLTGLLGALLLMGAGCQAAPTEVVLVARAGLGGSWRYEGAPASLQLTGVALEVRAAERLLDRLPVRELVDVVRYYTPPPGTEDCTSISWTDRPLDQREYLLLDLLPAEAGQRLGPLEAEDGRTLEPLAVRACAVP